MISKQDPSGWSLFDLLPHRVFCKGLDYTFTFCNIAYRDYLGLSEAQVVGRNELDFYPKEFAERQLATDQEVIDTDSTIESLDSYVLDDVTHCRAKR